MNTRIAANDPALAHALMRYATTREGDAIARRLKAMLPPPESMSVPKLSKAVCKAFGPLLVVELIFRRHGSRASAVWVALIASTAGDMVPLMLEYKRAQLRHSTLAFCIRSHAIARLAQRTIGSVDMAQSSKLMTRHIWLIFSLFAKIEDDRVAAEKPPMTLFNTVSQEGAFLWNRGDDGEWYASTWIDADAAADPQIRKDCANSTETHGRIRVLN